MAAELITRFRGKRRPAQVIQVNQWIAVAGMELLLRMRDTNVPIMAACVAAACVLLTPSAEAGYAVITFGGMKPIMSAETALVSAGLVLSLLMLPVYALGLGLGCARDRRLRIGAIWASSPVEAGSIAGGRLVANAAVVTAFSLVTLILIAVAIVSRMKHLPGAASMAAYLLIVTPAGLCSLPVGALLDRYFGEQNAAKAITTIMFWSVLMVTSLMAWPDAFGFTFLRQNVPVGAGPDFSVGIVGAEHMSRVSWKTVELTSSFLAARIQMLGTVFVVCIGVWLATRRSLLQSIGRVAAYAEAGSATVAIAAPALPRVRPSNARPVLAGWIVTRRWLKGSKLVALLFAASVTIGMVSASVRLALGVALLIPLAIVNARRLSGSLEIRLFERSNTALWRPSPLVFSSLLLVALTALPVIPALAHVTAQRGIHVLIAIAAASLWLTWSCAGIARPLMGISVFTLAWYLECFGSLPPAADLLGLSATSLPALAAAAGLTIVLGVLTLRKDSYGAPSTRNG
jgi:hypothetical protein